MRKQPLLKRIAISILGIACLIPVGIVLIMATAIFTSLIPNTHFPIQYFKDFICNPVPQSITNIHSYRTSGFGSFGWWVSFSISPVDFEILVYDYKKYSDFSDWPEAGNDPFRVQEQLFSAAKEIKLPEDQLGLLYKKHFAKEEEVYDVFLYATTNKKHVIVRISDE